MLLDDRSESPNIFGMSSTPFASTMSTKNSRRSMEQRDFLRNTMKEKKWVNNFNVMGSKNNDRVHKHYQEYFDRPVGYDNQGYKMGKLKSGEIYDRLSPPKYGTSQFAQRSKSMPELKPKSSNQSVPFEGASSPDLTNKRLEAEGEGSEKKESEKRIGNSSAIKDAIIHQRRKKGKRRNLRRSLETVHRGEKEYGAFPSLRGSKLSPSNKKKEMGWKQVGDPISTYNELVHASYRLGFDKL